MLEEKEEPGFLTGLKIPAPWAAGKTVETVHPVRDNYKFKETVHIPGARCLYLRFDNRCSSQYDYDKVSKDQLRNSFFCIYFRQQHLPFSSFLPCVFHGTLFPVIRIMQEVFMDKSLVVCTLMSWSPYFKAGKYGDAERLLSSFHDGSGCQSLTSFSVLLLFSFPYFSNCNRAAYFVDQHSLFKLGRTGRWLLFSLMINGLFTWIYKYFQFQEHN